jgi:hypothetical protein
MNGIKYNFEIFKDISFDECLNYKANDVLESSIRSIVESSVKKFQSKKFKDNDEYLESMLKYILLQTSSSTIWSDCVKELEFDQKYLYIVIKKNVYLAKPNLI